MIGVVGIFCWICGTSVANTQVIGKSYLPSSTTVLPPAVFPAMFEYLSEWIEKAYTLVRLNIYKYARAGDH